MIERTFDADLIKGAIGDYDVTGLDLDDWLSRPADITIALTNGTDVSLFQEDRPSVYFGHWFFKSRGKTAKAEALQMLDHLFLHFPVLVIIGFTPVENRAASWMARQVGFKSQGLVSWMNKELEFFMMTKNEWNAR